MAYKSINPYSGETVFEADYATDSEVAAALDTAHKAYKSWSKLSFEERAGYMRKAAAIFRERKDELGKLQSSEMGMPISMSAAQTEQMIPAMLEYYADNAEEFLKDEQLSSVALKDAYITNVPLGIIYAVEPWNVPYYQAIRPVCGNLMAGNVVILKHASVVPGSANAVAEIFKEVGLPEGVFTNLYATHDQSSTIIDDPRVRGVTLTGSDAAGSRIGEQAGRNIKPAVLELGGMDPQVVLDDADIAHTAQCSMFRFTLSGQACVSNKRIIVMDAVYDDFVAQYTELIESLVVGDPLDPATTLGPLMNVEQADQTRDQIRRAVEAGARAVEYGPKVPDIATFVQPTILFDVTPDNPIYREEIFGPVPMIFKVQTEEEAIELANDSFYGLGGSVYSKDEDRAKRVAREIDTGMVAINGPMNAPWDVPFGGTKRSGLGFEMGPHGIKEFVGHKVIMTP